MTDRDLCVEAGEGACGRGSGVAMNEDYVWATLHEDVTQTGEDACCDIGEVLTLLHDVEVVVRLDIEDGEHLVEHFAMLTGDAHDGFELSISLLKFLHKRTHLNGLGTSAKNEHYFLHIGIFYIIVSTQ